MHFADKSSLQDRLPLISTSACLLACAMMVPFAVQLKVFCAVVGSNLGDLIFLSKLLPLRPGAREEGSRLSCQSTGGLCNEWELFWTCSADEIRSCFLGTLMWHVFLRCDLSEQVRVQRRSGRQRLIFMHYMNHLCRLQEPQS